MNLEQVGQFRDDKLKLAVGEQLLVANDESAQIVKSRLRGFAGDDGRVNADQQ